MHKLNKVTAAGLGVLAVAGRCFAEAFDPADAVTAAGLEITAAKDSINPILVIGLSLAVVWVGYKLIRRAIAKV